jgi:hypothetical protein
MMFAMVDVQLLGDEVSVMTPHIGYYDPALGFSFNPIKHIKSAASSVAHVAKAAGSGAISVGQKVGGTALKIAVLPAYYVTKYAADIALRPVRSRVNTLVNRRAAKIAWDRRRSKTPTSAEHNQARDWAKAKFKSSGPHGHLLALLAGPTLTGQLGDFGVAPAVVAAAVPILVSILTGMIKKYAGTGEAPEDPAVDMSAPEPMPMPMPEPKPAPTEGPLGAAPEGSAAIVLLLLGLAAAGTGGYLAFKSR